MSLELIYTSATKGLKAGSSGFCTVAVTGGMSRTVSTKLEMLSGYEFPFKISDPNAKLSPVNYAHTRVSIDSGSQSVLSRISFSGSDYSGRANKIAHHYLLTSSERLQAGPACMMLKMQQKGLFQTDWQDSPKELPGKHLEQVLNAAQGENTKGGNVWKKITGDQGWAGILAQAFVQNKEVPAYVIFKPGQDILALFAESLSCLPQDIRWNVCFAAYYTVLPAGCYYHWRGILAGSASQKEIARFPNAIVIDLTQPLPAAADNLFSKAAREGTVVNISRTAAPSVVPEAAPQQAEKNVPDDNVKESPQKPRYADNKQKRTVYLTDADVAIYLPRPNRRESKKKYFILAASVLGILFVLVGAFPLYRFFLKEAPTISQTLGQISQKTKGGLPPKGTEKDAKQAAISQPEDPNGKAEAAHTGTDPNQIPPRIAENPSLKNKEKDPNESVTLPQTDSNTNKNDNNSKSSNEPQKSGLNIKDRGEFLENYRVKQENIKLVKHDPNSGKYNILFPLEKTVKPKEFLPFPKNIQREGIQTKLENGELIITRRSEDGLMQKTLATCVIEKDGLRYKMSEEVKTDAQKLPEEQRYYPIAKNIAIELFDGENIFQCQIRETKIETTSQDPNDFVRIFKPMDIDNLAKTLIEKLPQKLACEYTLPLQVSKTEEYNSLVERIVLENTLVGLDLRGQLKNISGSLKWINKKSEEKGRVQSNVDNLNAEIESLRKKLQNISPDKKNENSDIDKRIVKTQNKINDLNLEIQDLTTTITNEDKKIKEEIKGINLKIDELPLNIMPNDKKKRLKDFIETLGKPETLKEDFLVNFEDEWGIDVFSCTFTVQIGCQAQ